MDTSLNAALAALGGGATLTHCVTYVLFSAGASPAAALSALGRLQGDQCFRRYAWGADARAFPPDAWPALRDAAQGLCS